MNEEITLKSRLDRIEEIMKKYDNLFVMASQYILLEQQNKELKAKLELYENGVIYSSENEELHNKIDKAIDFIDIYTNGINLEAFDCLKLMYKIKDLLKDGDVDE